MVTVKVEQFIGATSDEVLELVMDIERYADVDAKISPVLWARRTNNRVEFACRPKLAGIRQPRVVQFIDLTPGRRIDIGLLPRPQNRLAHAMARFNASFDCVDVDGGAIVTRELTFEFSPAVRWLMEPLFRRRLQRDVEDEMRQAKHFFESRDATPS